MKQLIIAPEFKAAFRKIGKKITFKCRDCNRVQIHTGKAAHEVAMCSGECLTARVGRITIHEH